ncbi:Sec-independent protein translocase protein TatB [Gammaproteobacteria bacterium]
MFDVGFSEVLVIALVALLVVGPEQLPKLARTVGLWMGRIRYFVHSVKVDIDRELKAEELQRILKEQAGVRPLESILDETRQAISDLKRDLDPTAIIASDVARSSAPALPTTTPSPPTDPPPASENAHRPS